SFAVGREIVLPAGHPRVAADAPVGSARIARFACDAVDLDVDARTDARAVLVDAYDPGWRASVDGKAATVERANVAFRAVAVPPGRHRLTLRYRPAAVYGG